MAKIAWSRIASDAVVAFVLREQEIAGSVSAKALQQGITVRVRLLRGFPELGKPVPELSDGDIRELPIGAYRVLYRATDDMVLILNIVQIGPPLSPSPPDGHGKGNSL